MATTQKNMKRQIAIAALLTIIIAAAAIYGCKKDNIIPSENALLTLSGTDRLMSVANVYLTDDADKAEVWFYETPVIFDFSVRTTVGKNNFEMLKYACEKKLPVNIRTIANVENMIDRVFPPTTEQLAAFKAEMATREVALPASAVTKDVYHVPNMDTLNAIFNTVKNQCCLCPGGFITGQCIPFQYAGNGCWARAHKIRQIIENKFGCTSYKIFNYACDMKSTLTVKVKMWKIDSTCCQRWWYHVGSYVFVPSEAGNTQFVIDPSLFDHPATVSEWLIAQRNNTSECEYGGAPQGQVYYAGNAYAPLNLNKNTCTLIPYSVVGYILANLTCAIYSDTVKYRGCKL